LPRPCHWFNFGLQWRIYTIDRLFAPDNDILHGGEDDDALYTTTHLIHSTLSSSLFKISQRSLYHEKQRSLIAISLLSGPALHAAKPKVTFENGMVRIKCKDRGSTAITRQVGGRLGIFEW